MIESIEFLGIPFLKVKNTGRCKKYYLLGIRFKKKKLKKEKILIIPPQGLGDILWILSILRNSTIVTQEKYAVVVTKKSFFKLLELFEDIVDTKILTTPENLSNFKENNIVAQALYNQSRKFMTFKELLEFHFNGKTEKKPTYYPEIISNKAYYLSSTQKNVIISPEAVTVPDVIPLAYWKKYALKLREKGFNVIFNTDNPIFKTEFNCIFLDVVQTLSLIEEAHYFIGYRSGFCDCVSHFTDAYMIVFYPNVPMPAGVIKDYNKNPVKRYMDFCSLKNFHPEKNIHEYIYTSNIYPIFNELNKRED